MYAILITSKGNGLTKRVVANRSPSNRKFHPTHITMPQVIITTVTTTVTTIDIPDDCVAALVTDPVAAPVTANVSYPSCPLPDLVAPVKPFRTPKTPVEAPASGYTFQSIADIVGRKVNAVTQRCKPYIITDKLSTENRRESPLAKKLDNLGYDRATRHTWKKNGIPDNAAKVILESYGF